MICRKVTKNLSALIDETLTPQEEAMVKKHLQECEYCREELAGLRATVQAVRSLGMVEPPEHFQQGIHARLVKLQGVAPQPRFRNKRLLQPFAAAVVALCIVAVLALNAVYPEFLLSLGKYWTSPMESGTLALSPEPSEEKLLAGNSRARDTVLGPPSIGSAEETGPTSASGQDSAPAIKPDPAPPVGEEVFDQHKNLTENLQKQEQVVIERYSMQGLPAGQQVELLPPSNRVSCEAHLKLSIAEVDRVKGAVSKLAVDHQGYVEDAVLAGKSQAVAGECALTVRIPQGEFDRVLGLLVTMGQIVDKKIDKESIGHKIEEANEKLEKQKAEEKKLIEQTILSNCPELQSQLQQIQSDIHATSNELLELNQKANIATINLTLIQE